ncbi:hypothetical protein BAUCODRAFT_399677 [Baudoinia panamericana UAMH 10762]|uniref:Uncharacterized protein n=1 Tax=Baudoinia panamericana (strain UAMH 10762) TaxID=717646 RepID=M2NIV9_BAUPA|nr:uncharacterized protein BAUCODRAFT_399677 [Baudoinia panamericana UAMH 10762]EMC99334.1 hypothetical protein BAUCODRAFT_399677 [Baudoinia panamericana UAMH 10762]
MANPMFPSASHQVLLNPDLLDCILPHLNTPAIQSLRLINYYFEENASPHLFRSLTVGLRKRYLRRLKRVAETPKFAKGVTEFVWETLHYTIDPSGGIGGTCAIETELRSCAEWLGYSDAGEQTLMQLGGSSSAATAMKRYLALQADEMAIIGDENDGSFLALCKQVTAGFEAFPRLRHIAITRFAEKHRALWDGDACLGLKTTNVMPPPIAALSLYPYAPSEITVQRNNFALRTIFFALMQSGRQIESFRVETTTNLCTEPLLYWYPIPGILLSWDGLVEAGGDTIKAKAGSALQNVKEVKLDMSDTLRCATLGTSNLSDFVARCNGLPAYLGLLKGLETLDLRIEARVQDFAVRNFDEPYHWRAVISLAKAVGPEAHFDRLRNLTLRDLWLEVSELSAFLCRHADTLETVQLYGLNLGGMGAVGLVMADVASVGLNPEEETVSCSMWEELVEACKALPRLEGLVIENLSIGPDWTALNVFDCEAIVDEAMDGRENALAPRGRFGNMLEQLGM